MGLFVGSFSQDSMSAGMNVLAFIIPFIMLSAYLRMGATWGLEWMDTVHIALQVHLLRSYAG
jgi:hypothetical protein